MASPAIAEPQAGDASQVVVETDLRDSPEEEAESYGRLPKGTLVIQRGETRNGFMKIWVELESGSLEGWVFAGHLDRATREGGSEPEGTMPEEPDPSDRARRLRPRPRLVVPKDEGLLIRRERSFFYGVQTGFNFNVLETNIDDFFYLGGGFGVGAHVGMYLIPDIPFRLEMFYTLAQGTNDNGELIQVGFFDTALVATYAIDRFEIFGGAQFSVGLSLNDISPSIQLGAPQDLSAIYVVAGAGYRVPLGEITTMVVRARYAFSFLRAPIGVQYGGAFVYLEFGG